MIFYKPAQNIAPDTRKALFSVVLHSRSEIIFFRVKIKHFFVKLKDFVFFFNFDSFLQVDLLELICDFSLIGVSPTGGPTTGPWSWVLSDISKKFQNRMKEIWGSNLSLGIFIKSRSLYIKYEIFESKNIYSNFFFKFSILRHKRFFITEF